MKGPLLSLLALCLLAVQAHVDVDPNFDLKRFAGKWRVLALASTDPMFQSLKDIITTPAAHIAPLPEGNLEIESYYLLGDNCEGMRGTYVRTEQPGHFTAHDEKGKKDLRVLASDASFAIVYVQREMKGMPPNQSLQLYSRGPKGGQNLDKFKAVCQQLGLATELVVPPLSDKCFNQISG